MTILRLLVLVAFLAAGLVVGSLNPQRILLDFGVVEIATTTGIAITVSLLAGVLLGGGIVMATTVLPLQARLRRAGRSAAVGTGASEAPRPPYQGT
jgi:NaMN:DMB phosphoribosyltransferase